MSEDMDATWLLVDIDGEAAHFGIADPSATPQIRNVRSYQTANFPTATDCFIGYAKDAGISLKGLKCGVSVSGAVGLDSVRLQRCRWVFSITGLSYVLGSRPLVINDGHLKSWSNIALNPLQNTKLGGEGTVDFAKPGKWVTINYVYGLGASLLCREADNRIFAIDSECGHIGFAAQDELQEKLQHFLSRTRTRVTYEQMLFLDRKDPLLLKAGIEMSPAEYDQMRASVLGAFVGDMALSFVGWSGVFLHCGTNPLLKDPALADAFNLKFEDKGNFKGTMRGTPRYLVPSQPTNLPGVAQMMALRHNVN
jgi:glucokinase